VLIRWIALTVSVWAAVEIVPGMSYDHWQTIVLTALVLGVLNVLVKPLLTVISIPFIVLSFGLFLVVINAVVLKMAAWLVPGFTVADWGAAFLGSIVISLVSMLCGGTNVKITVSRW
jgi:putative membrane protein